MAIVAMTYIMADPVSSFVSGSSDDTLDLDITVAPVRGSADTYNVCYEIKEHKQFRVTCIAPSSPTATFTGVVFASYGTPIGSCTTTTNLNADPACHAPDSVAKVRAACVGKRTCVLPSTNAFFGKDPCVGKVKRLVVKLVGDCSNVRIEESDPICGPNSPCPFSAPCCSIYGFCGSSTSHCNADSCFPAYSYSPSSSCYPYPSGEYCGPNSDTSGIDVGPLNKIVPEFYPVQLQPTYPLGAVAVWLSPCCKIHDGCYGTCGNSQMKCDNDIESCIVQRCTRNYVEAKYSPPQGSLSGCIQRAQLYKTAIQKSIGYDIYTKSQLHCQNSPKCFETGTCGSLGDICNPRNGNDDCIPRGLYEGGHCLESSQPGEWHCD